MPSRGSETSHLKPREVLLDFEAQLPPSVVPVTAGFPMAKAVSGRRGPNCRILTVPRFFIGTPSRTAYSGHTFGQFIPGE